MFHVSGEQFNTNVKETPRESPWSNGMGERHNAVLRKMINKLIWDKNTKFPIDVIFAWAVSINNSLYRRNQLVFGKKPIFPSNVTYRPPAMEDITPNQLVLKHLNAMHAARKAFIEAESNEKLHRALK